MLSLGRTLVSQPHSLSRCVVSLLVRPATVRTLTSTVTSTPQPTMIIPQGYSTSPTALPSSSTFTTSSSSSTPSSSLPPAGGHSVHSTVDPAEIHKFATMAAQWWDPHGQVKPLHKMNPTRVLYIRDQIIKHFSQQSSQLTSTQSFAPSISRPFQGLTMLDVGCGGGLLSESLARLGGQVHGVDASGASIVVAKTHASLDPDLNDKNLIYTHTTAESLLAAGHKYDVVCALEIIEHVNQPQTFINTVASLVKPGGLLFLSTINKTQKSWLLAIVGAEYIARMVPIGTHHWDKFIEPRQLIELVKTAKDPAEMYATQQRDDSSNPSNYADNQPQKVAQSSSTLQYSVTDITGMIYNPLTGNWSLSHSDIDVNYIMTSIRSK